MREMTLRDFVLSTLRANREVLDTYGVESISLFGSVARGDDGPQSDVDLLVSLHPGTTLFGLARIQSRLEDILERRVDLVTPDALRPHVRDSILAEAILAM